LTYSTLYARLLDETDRSDITDARYQYWLRDAEAYFNRVLRTRGMVQRDTADISDRFSTVPDDFIAPRTMRYTAAPYTLLQFLSPVQMAEVKASGRTYDSLSFYSISGPEFEFFPVPSAPVNVTLEYEQYVPALTAAAPTNWLLNQHPDAYFRGVMWQAGSWLKDNDIVSLNKAAMDEVLAQIESADRHDAMAFNITPTPSAIAV
jgi:hypothetical protein